MHFLNQSSILSPQLLIVCDAESARNAARNLWHYLGLNGVRAKLIDAREFNEEYSGAVVVIGHHKLSEKWIEEIKPKYNSDSFFAYGFSKKKCILTADRERLGHGDKGRKKFERCYNEQITSYQNITEFYAIAQSLGKNETTKESQYNLLWLEFTRYCLSDFLAENHIVVSRDEFESEGMVVNRSNNRQESEIGELETKQLHICVDITITNSVVRALVRNKKIDKYIANMFLGKKKIPLELKAFDLTSISKVNYKVNIIATVTDYTSLVQLLLPVLMKKYEGKTVYRLIFDGVEILDLTSIQEATIKKLIIKAVSEYENKICIQLTKLCSKKVRGIIFNSLKVE